MPEVLNIIGGISPNAVSSTGLKINEYFNSSSCTTVIFDDYNETVSDVFNDMGIHHEYLGSSLPIATLNLFKILTLGSKDWDILHIYGGAIDQLPIPALHSEITGSDLIIRYNGYHQSETYWKQKVINMAELYMLKRSDALVFNAEAQKQDILSKYKISNTKKTHIIPPGIPEKWFNPIDNSQLNGLRNEIGISDESFIIGSCLTPRPVKRIDRALFIIDKLSKNYDIDYIVVGDSEYVPQYQKLAENMGISDIVHWIGKYHSKELSNLYSLFDVTIMTSSVEGFGQSITESYLCKTPCVAFDVGGMCDQIIHGETGFLADPGNTAEFSEYIKKYIEDPQLLEDFGEVGNEFVKNNFTLINSSAKYNELIESLKQN